MARILALLLCLTAVTVFAKGKNADQRKFVRDKLFKNLKNCILIDPVNLLTANFRLSNLRSNAWFWNRKLINRDLKSKFIHYREALMLTYRNFIHLRE